MALSRRSPMRRLMNLDRWFDELDPFDRDRNGDTSVTTWTPRVDVYEREDRLVFECEAPGLEKEDLDVSLENNRLTIRGERREEREVESDDRDYLRSERIYGTFQRTFALPDTVERAEIQAEYNDGVLTVSVPVRSEARKKSIEVQ